MEILGMILISEVVITVIVGLILFISNISIKKLDRENKIGIDDPTLTTREKELLRRIEGLNKENEEIKLKLNDVNPKKRQEWLIKLSEAKESLITGLFNECLNTISWKVEDGKNHVTVTRNSMAYYNVIILKENDKNIILNRVIKMLNNEGLFAELKPEGIYIEVK